MAYPAESRLTGGFFLQYQEFPESLAGRFPEYFGGQNG
jgi:hypothetical protein